MAYQQTEQRDLSGILFKNDRQRNDKDPGYTGHCTIDGVKYWMSAWVKDGAKGKFFSFSFKAQEPKQASKPATRPAAAPTTTRPAAGVAPPPTPAPNPEYADDDVPF